MKSFLVPGCTLASAVFVLAAAPEPLRFVPAPGTTTTFQRRIEQITAGQVTLESAIVFQLHVTLSEGLTAATENRVTDLDNQTQPLKEPMRSAQIARLSESWTTQFHAWLMTGAHQGSEQFSVTSSTSCDWAVFEQFARRQIPSIELKCQVTRQIGGTAPATAPMTLTLSDEGDADVKVSAGDFHVRTIRQIEATPDQRTETVLKFSEELGQVVASHAVTQLHPDDLDKPAIGSIVEGELMSVQPPP